MRAPPDIQGIVSTAGAGAERFGLFAFMAGIDRFRAQHVHAVGNEDDLAALQRIRALGEIGEARDRIPAFHVCADAAGQAGAPRGQQGHFLAAETTILRTVPANHQQAVDLFLLQKRNALVDARRGVSCIIRIENNAQAA